MYETIRSHFVISSNKKLPNCYTKEALNKRAREAHMGLPTQSLQSPCRGAAQRWASSILEANLNFADGISDPPSSLPPRLPNSLFFHGSFLLPAKPSRTMHEKLEISRG